MTFQKKLNLKKNYKLTIPSIFLGVIVMSITFAAIPQAHSQTTIILDDDYSTNAGWIPVGSLITVDDPNFLDVVKFDNVPDSQDRRVHKSLNTVLNDTQWGMDSEILIEAHSGNPAHRVFLLTAGNGEVFTIGNDYIGLTYTNTGDPGIGFHIIYQDASTQVATGSKILVGAGEQVYIRLTRSSATDVTLGVYSDPQRTIHVPGSPVAVTDIPATVIGLDTLQHANGREGGPSRALTAVIDNTIIYEGPPPQTGLNCNGLLPTIEGTAGNDHIIGTPGDDVIMGFDGDDYVLGNGGNDTICGGDGDDFIRGGEGEDYIDGDAGKDLIMGDQGNDVLKGSGGADVILGGSGADTLKGGNGNDRLSGGSEDDTLNGGTNDFDTCDNTEPNDTLVECERSN